MSVTRSRISRTALMALCAANGWGDPASALAGSQAEAGPPEPSQSDPPPQIWNFHSQSTFVAQADPPFAARYSGANSLQHRGEAKETWSVDFILGARLWPGGEAYVDGLMWQGHGLSEALGAAGFPNGEAFRKGTQAPNATFSRAFLRQTFALGGDSEHLDDRAFQLAGPKDSSRLTLTAGKLSAKDFFDGNAFANDPRTQFLNWGLMANGAWDYPADALGYAPGLVTDLQLGSWSARYGVFGVMRSANGVSVDQRFDKAQAMVWELERRFSLSGHPGTLRTLAYLNSGHMRRYEDTIAQPALLADPSLPHSYSKKLGFGFSLDQELTHDLGAFLRLGWNDGRSETWMFTDIDRTVSIGLALKGTSWGRSGDTVGLAGLANEISGPHRAFLAAGGTGITVGDGQLNYRPEEILETYYDFRIAEGLNASLDYQCIFNPAFNQDRGPAHVVAARLHWQL